MTHPDNEIKKYDGEPFGQAVSCLMGGRDMSSFGSPGRVSFWPGEKNKTKNKY